MKLPIYQVDTFTDQLFSGNPAAVVLPHVGLSAETMQQIAAENNLSETAFVVRKGEGYQIRWFTPTVEVDLCGHATLASAHVIFNHLEHSSNTVSFSSKRGPLQVRKDGEVLYLNFPADKPRKVETPPQVIDGLGAKPHETYRCREDYLTIFDDERAISALSPNMDVLCELPAVGVIASAPGHKVDFVSRYFAPQVGIPEDPVTGSAHTALIPYWSNRLGKTSLHARQISKRGGELMCRDLDDRVEIGGQAVTYLMGELSL